MIKIENVEVMGWEHTIRGIRNTMGSWNKSDSGICKGGDDGIGCENCVNCDSCEHAYDHSWQLGKADHDLMMRLEDAGYRRMITVNLDITAPLYWWKDFYTYEVGAVADSCSAMSELAAKAFTLDDFSCEHLDIRTIKVLEDVVNVLNDYMTLYVNYNADDFEIKGCPSKECIWWQMIQLLPSSYNQKRTVMLNYETLTGVYPMLKNHELDEWVEFRKWIEVLPYSEIIIGKAMGIKHDSIL